VLSALSFCSYFDKIDRCMWSKNIAYAHLALTLQFRQMSIQLIFRNSFATVELIDTDSNLCLNSSRDVHSTDLRLGRRSAGGLV